MNIINFNNSNYKKHFIFKLLDLGVEFIDLKLNTNSIYGMQKMIELNTGYILMHEKDLHIAKKYTQWVSSVGNKINLN